jgi:hypothetical protein
MEGIPLLQERILILRECGTILCQVSLRTTFHLMLLTKRMGYMQRFHGSYQNFLAAFEEAHGGPDHATALQCVRMIVNTFPRFQDEVNLSGHKSEFPVSVFTLILTIS